MEDYKEIEALWEILAPSAELRSEIDAYKKLADLYAVVRNAYAMRVNTPVDLANKTKTLIEAHVSQFGLGRLTKSVTFDLATLETLQSCGGSDEAKIFNLLRGLQQEIDEQPDMAPILHSLKDRADRILQALEERKTTGLQAIDRLSDLVKEKEAAKKAAHESGLSQRSFSVMWRLQQDEIFKKYNLSASSVAAEVDVLLERFPNAAVNPDEERQFRSQLYHPLLTTTKMTKEERAQLVDSVMEALFS